MPEPVVYELDLRDKFSSVIKGAESSAEKFEGTLSHAKGVIEQVGVALTAAFGVYKIEEFVRESGEVFEKLKQANEQLKAGLESTHYQAGVTYDDLQDSQRKFRSEVDYSTSAISDMQSQILTFPGITKNTFDQASQAILDMATRLHHGLDETAIMVGKALQDPEHGITALRRVGVNFNEVQTEMVKKMVETGQAAKAQAFILNELNTEFAGSAKAAREASVTSDYRQSIEELQLTIGELIEEITANLAPTLIAITNWFKGLAEWIKRNGSELGELIKIIGAAILAYKGMSIIVGIVQSIAVSVGELGAVQSAEAIAAGEAATANTGFASSMGLVQASLGPIIISLTAIVGLYTALKDNLITVQDMQSNVTPEMKENVRRQAEKDIQYESQRLEYAGIGTGENREDLAITNTKQDYQEKLKKYKDIVDGFTAISKDIPGGGSLFANNNKDYQDAIAQVTILTERIKALDTIAANKKNLALGKDTATKNQLALSAVDKGTKASPSKSVNIRIDIKELVHELRISTTTLQEGTSKAKDMVAASLISAVNDSQIIAGE